VLVTRYLESAALLDAEATVLAAVEELGWISFNDAIWLDVFGNGFALTSLVIFSAAVATNHRRPLVAASLVLGYASLFFPVITGWLVWARPRPTLIADGIGSPGASLGSFPSGHLVQAIVAFGMLAFFWARESPARSERTLVAVLFLLVVATTTLARLRLGAHWPSDMVAAGVIGAAWLAAVLRACLRAERRCAPGAAPQIAST
jgi:membrane-associated phospholipid phosphatase